MLRVTVFPQVHILPSMQQELCHNQTLLQGIARCCKEWISSQRKPEHCYLQLRCDLVTHHDKIGT